MYDIAVALSVVLSFGLYEGFGLLTGGMVSAGYLCLFLEEPLRIVTTLLLAVIVHGLVLFLKCRREVFFRQQVYCFFPILNTSRCIDARSDFKHNIADGDFLFRKSAYVDNSLHTNARVTVQLLQTVVGEDTVFTHNRNDVRCNTHSYNIQQRNQVVELDTVTDSECLHKLETDSTTRKVSVRVRIVQAFGVQNSYGRRKHIIRYMMIADDEINPFLFGISNFLYCFNSTIEYNN